MAGKSHPVVLYCTGCGAEVYNCGGVLCCERCGYVGSAEDIPLRPYKPLEQAPKSVSSDDPRISDST